jgi:23S rRNA (uracil747-C5)-methyltransferase
MDCHHFAAGRCRSCTLLETPYATQVADKQDAVAALLGRAPVAWSEPFTSQQQGFRNKAKMVVTGTAQEPVLGILRPDGTGVDLRDCPLHEDALHAALPVLADFVGRADLTPYDVRQRRGELKHLLVTAAPGGDLMVRFVLRSQEPVARIRKHLPGLLERLPDARVVSVNLQPEHKAVLEGEREIVLTGQESLTMRVDDLDLHLRPQGFFQTNTAVAAGLYRQAAAWAADAAPSSVWDLYCGVGGFALHLAGPGRTVTGVELSGEAVASAERTAADAGLPGTRFLAGDATTWAVNRSDHPDLVVVNPPRRGIGADLAGWLERSGTPRVLYSSCNPASLVRDLEAMPSYAVRRGRLFDMFPNTAHAEVLVDLDRVR